MLLVNLLLVIGVPLLIGILILSLALRKTAEFFSSWEKLALSFAVGIGSLVILMFLMAIAKIPLTLLTITTSTGIFVALSSAYLFTRKTFLFDLSEIKQAFNIKTANYSNLEMILLFFVMLKVLYTYFTALIKPLVDVDAFQFYSIVAKALLYDKTFLTPYLSQFIHDKPLFAYLSQGWVLLGLQSANDSLIKIISPTLFLCLVVIIFSVLRRYFSRVYALLFAFLSSTFPFIVYHSATAYADLPMTFYYATGTIYLFLFLKEQANRNNDKALANLIIATFLLGLSIWIKRAGLILGLINLAVLTFYFVINKKLISKDTLKLIIVPAVIFMIVAGPWLIYGQKGTFIRVTKGIIGIEEPVVPGQTVAERPIKPEVNMIITIFLRKAFLYADWHLLFLLFVVSLLFFYKRSFSGPNIYLLVIITLDLFVIVGQFMSKEMYPWLLDGTLLDRLLMNVIPVILFFCAEATIPGLKGSFSAGENRAYLKNKKGS